MPKLSYEDMIARRIDLPAKKPATSKAEFQTIEAVRAYTAGILRGFKPELIILVPWRIFFIEGDGFERLISSQTYTHAWIVWPERSKRAGNEETRIEWASQHVEVQPWH